MEEILKYFPDLSQTQISQFSALENLYKTWNDKINVISRKDIDNIYVHHVLHALSIAKFISFENGTQVLDLGTGGGFPGIPLAIFFPNCQFTLIDGTNKKIKVVQDIINQLDLGNANAMHQRAEDHLSTYGFVVIRAVAHIDKLIAYTDRLIHNVHKNKIPNGILALKGGDLNSELTSLNNKAFEQVSLSDYFAIDYYEDKHLVYVPV